MLIEFPFPLAGRGQGRGESAIKAVNGSFTHPPPLPLREGSFLYDMEPLMKNSNNDINKGYLFFRTRIPNFSTLVYVVMSFYPEREVEPCRPTAKEVEFAA